MRYSLILKELFSPSTVPFHLSHHKYASGQANIETISSYPAPMIGLDHWAARESFMREAQQNPDRPYEIP
jgi:hypothetical protein